MELEYFGYPEAVREDGNLGTALVSELFLLEQKQRVQLAAEIRKTIGVKKPT